MKSKAKEYHDNILRTNLTKTEIKRMRLVSMYQNHKTLEDVKELIGRLKELGYDEVPENWYVDGKEFLAQLKKLKL